MEQIEALIEISKSIEKVLWDSSLPMSKMGTFQFLQDTSERLNKVIAELKEAAGE